MATSHPRHQHGNDGARHRRGEVSGAGLLDGRHAPAGRRSAAGVSRRRKTRTAPRPGQRSGSELGAVELTRSSLPCAATLATSVAPAEMQRDRIAGRSSRAPDRDAGGFEAQCDGVLIAVEPPGRDLVPGRSGVGGVRAARAAAASRSRASSPSAATASTRSDGAAGGGNSGGVMAGDEPGIDPAAGKCVMREHALEERNVGGHAGDAIIRRAPP